MPFLSNLSAMSRQSTDDEIDLSIQADEKGHVRGTDSREGKGHSWGNKMRTLKQALHEPREPSLDLKIFAELLNSSQREFTYDLTKCMTKVGLFNSSICMLGFSLHSVRW